MGLKEEAEELRKQIAIAQEKEGELIENKEEKEEKKEESVEQKQEEEKKEEVKEETKEEVKEEEKQAKTNADYARERRERVENKKLQEQLAEANARLAALESAQKKPETQDADAEPDKESDPLGWADWRVRQAEKKASEVEKTVQSLKEKNEKEEKIKQREVMYSQAQKELIGYEESFKKSSPDFDDVKNYYIGMMAMGIKTLNPSISNEDLGKAVTSQIMMRASNYLNQGWENPVEAIYQEAKAMGYTPKQAEEEKKTPDLARVAKNMERNAGMAGAGAGSGKGELTKRYAATELTASEWAKLPKSERERILRSA